MSKIQLHETQKDAIHKVIRWYYLDSYNKNYFSLSGGASIMLEQVKVF